MKKLVVQFIEARDGGPMARFRDGLNTRVAFPDRSWRPLPRIGSTWEVEVAGLNPRRTVAFLRPVREIRDDVVAEPEPEVAPVSSRVLADETIDDLVRDALDRAKSLNATEAYALAGLQHHLESDYYQKTEEQVQRINAAIEEARAMFQSVEPAREARRAQEAERKAREAAARAEAAAKERERIACINMLFASTAMEIGFDHAVPDGEIEWEYVYVSQVEDDFSRKGYHVYQNEVRFRAPAMGNTVMGYRMAAIPVVLLHEGKVVREATLYCADNALSSLPPAGRACGVSYRFAIQPVGQQ